MPLEGPKLQWTSVILLRRIEKNKNVLNIWAHKNKHRGRGVLLGRLEHTVGMKYISCGSTLTASTCVVSHPKSSMLMELCLETHCICHHTSQLRFPNTIQSFPLMSSPWKKKIQTEAPGLLQETLPNSVSCDFHLQLKEGIPCVSTGFSVLSSSCGAS